MADAPLESRVDLLERQVKELRRQVQQKGEEIEVLQTNPVKRWLWFVPQGWLPYTVGRWYGKGEDGDTAPAP